MIFGPDDLPNWADSHAAVPLVSRIIGSSVEVLFSGRDQSNRSQVASFELDLLTLEINSDRGLAPLLSPGDLGEFDEDGAMASCLVATESGCLLYYIGWNRAVSVPFRNSIGLAKQSDGGGFLRLFPGPILDRTKTEPHFTASSFVYRETENLWRMWYLSGTRWSSETGGARHHYNIKYAESSDGVEWLRSGQVAIDFKDSGEYAIARPWVIREADKWVMWYSYRGESYKIGYAESIDGIEWERKDSQVELEQSSSGWDSEMVEYPCVFDALGSRWLLYNGNGYGRTGIGLAVLEDTA